LIIILILYRIIYDIIKRKYIADIIVTDIATITATISAEGAAVNTANAANITTVAAANVANTRFHHCTSI
jgi:hypothetical protein